MTFVAHGIAGAGLCALPFVKARPWLKWTAAIFGFLGGIAPDAADWIAATLFGATRWTLYTRMHSGDLAEVFIYHPAYCLHLAVDSVIHRFPGYNWWPEYWWLEIALWLLGAGWLWLVFSTKRDFP